MSQLDDIIDKELLEMLRERIVADIEQDETEIQTIQNRIAGLMHKLHRVDQRLAEFSTKQAPALELTPTGRVKRGASKELVSDFFKASNGTGATINQAVAATKTKYGTARTVILNLEKEGKLEKVGDSKWRWAHDPFL